MNSSEIRVLREKFSRAVSFSILLAVSTNIVSMFFVIGSETWAESFTPGSTQPFYEFEDKPSEKLSQRRVDRLSSNGDEFTVLPQEAWSQQGGNKTLSNTTLIIQNIR
ncbi:MAG: hypothetical protein QXF52_06855 [Thermoproteota archaeon]